jgi:hypothetical protein
MLLVRTYCVCSRVILTTLQPRYYKSFVFPHHRLTCRKKTIRRLPATIDSELQAQVGDTTPRLVALHYRWSAGPPIFGSAWDPQYKELFTCSTRGYILSSSDLSSNLVRFGDGDEAKEEVYVVVVCMTGNTRLAFFTDAATDMSCRLARLRSGLDRGNERSYPTPLLSISADMVIYQRLVGEAGYRPSLSARSYNWPPRRSCLPRPVVHLVGRDGLGLFSWGGRS